MYELENSRRLSLMYLLQLVAFFLEPIRTAGPPTIIFLRLSEYSKLGWICVWENQFDVETYSNTHFQGTNVRHLLALPEAEVTNGRSDCDKEHNVYWGNDDKMEFVCYPSFKPMKIILGHLRFSTTFIRSARTRIVMEHFIPHSAAPVLTDNICRKSMLSGTVS